MSEHSNQRRKSSNRMSTKKGPQNPDNSVPTASAIPTPITTMLSEFKNLAGTFGGLFAIWALGYFNMSWLWILAGSVVVVWKRRMTKEKNIAMKSINMVSQSEAMEILKRLEDLPSWVYFPDIERAEWLNKLVKQLWPFINTYVETYLRENVEPIICQNLPTILQSFHFETINLGRQAPKITGVKVFTEHVKRDEILMDLEIFYGGDCDIEVAMKRFKAGIRDLQIRGKLRVVFKPLVPKAPFFGAISVHFHTTPTIYFNLTNMADILEMPGLDGLLDNIIRDQISRMLVLPNRLVIPLMDDVDVTSLKYPQPQGVLRICVKAGRQLISGDIGLLSKGKSDPYAVLHVGSQTFKTNVVENDLNPTWNKYYEAVIHSCQGQMLDIAVFDEDPGNRDDPLGNNHLPVATIARKGSIDSWFPLKDVKSGEIWLQLKWLSLVNTKDSLIEILADNKTIESGVKNIVPLSSAVLLVKLDSACYLPVQNKKSLSGLPSPYCTLTVGSVTKKSQTIIDSVDPTWEEGFEFLLKNPSIQNLDLDVIDSERSRSIGSICIQLDRVLNAPEMTLDIQPFTLQKSGPRSIVNARLSIRILKPEILTDIEDEFGEEEDEDLSDAEDVVDEGTTDAVSSNDKVVVDQTEVTNADASNIEQPVVASESTRTLSESSAPSSVLKHRTQSAGTSTGAKIYMTLRYNAAHSKLIAVVHKIQNLKPLESETTANPYVRLYLLPDRSKSGRRKTDVIKHSLNPVFEDTFEFRCIASEFAEKTLDIAVKTELSFLQTGKNEIGFASIHLSMLDQSTTLTDWYDLSSSPGN